MYALISIHALLAESDEGKLDADLWVLYFYPRSPCGERPFKIGENLMDRKDFYPRSPCGERHLNEQEVKRKLLISIHALLAESDRRSSKTARRFRYFYPRSPCGERLAVPDLGKRDIGFLSTLSLRRATRRP